MGTKPKAPDVSFTPWTTDHPLDQRAQPTAANERRKAAAIPSSCLECLEYNHSYIDHSIDRSIDRSVIKHSHDTTTINNHTYRTPVVNTGSGPAPGLGVTSGFPAAVRSRTSTGSHVAVNVKISIEQYYLVGTFFLTGVFIAGCFIKLF